MRAEGPVVHHLREETSVSLPPLVRQSGEGHGGTVLGL